MYTEVQQNKTRWVLLVLSVAALTIFFSYLHNRFAPVDPNPSFTIVLYLSAGLIYLLGVSFMLFQRLETRLDKEGMHFKAPLSWAKWQHIGWHEIDRIFVREYALFGEYPKGMMGLRQGPGGFAYAPQYGLFGLQIKKNWG
nr:hypothetical protein A6C57_18570 [Fibrella sp. ES10-3-2-2]